MHSQTILYATLSLINLSSAIPSLHPRWEWPSFGTETVKRTARVAILNNSPQTIKSVSLVHKYSSVFKNHAQWPEIRQQHIVNEDNETVVEYNTGLWTTGKDWWLLSFYSHDMRTHFYTDPNNLRDFVDFLETLAPIITISIAGGAAGVLGALSGPVTGIVASTAACALAKATTDKIFNSEGTVGFKQHILRESDAGQTTVISINRDYSVTFHSTGSPSSTWTSRRPAEIQVKDEKGAVVDEIRKS
ncbi:Transmembrane amino acid transporter family protein [Ophiocordyceps camponoti-floridani]|uniref:Transmembrane amino acid transporter family protein n=1 Tax=Ophiocordyceps camponoti-floridani TaxID=2030778 RepID=A0A8H4VBW1_9HYPO|nr:Transmembrane amino acid transporter family protein [Ophiocordyceps camponoti-floridani]